MKRKSFNPYASLTFFPFFPGRAPALARPRLPGERARGGRRQRVPGLRKALPRHEGPPGALRAHHGRHVGCQAGGSQGEAQLVLQTAV